MILRKYYPTIVLSDIHLGSEHSRTEEVTRFLKHVDCDRLILNGDIIDGWQLKKSGKRWKQKHTDFFKVLMKMMEKRGTEIIYVVGNHDDFLDSLAPFKFSNISIVKDYLLKTRQGKRYFVTHGDIFDTVTTHMRWLAMLGDVGYTFLLWLNKAPWVSLALQGYEGTQQILFSVESVTSNQGEEAAAIFKKDLTIRGGGVLLYPLENDAKPGVYKVSVRLTNPGYSHVLRDAMTIIVE